MLRIVLIRPGSTDYDDQGRIMGKLDIPLSAQGASQVARTAEELTQLPIEVVYTSPCRCAEQTAELVAQASSAKVKRLDTLHNLDQGLWQGKLIEEVRQRQPKVYRQWREHPETVCPPEGEALTAAAQRVEKALVRLLKKHRHGTIAIVLPEPLASVARSHLNKSELGDLWKAECEHGNWELIDIQPQAVGA